MPNTLAHIGIQTLITRGLLRCSDLRLILLGCLIPDIPWILRRLILVPLAGPLEGYWQPGAWILLQASLLFSLLLAGSIVLCTRHPRRSFAILGGGALLHLLLDALQEKWGNGVLLLVPFFFDLFSLPLFSIESWPTLLLTCGGLLTLLFYRKELLGGPFPLIFPSPRRRLMAALLLAGYFLLPGAFLDGIWQSDTNGLRTMFLEAERTGAQVRLDRQPQEQLDGLTHLTPPGRPPIELAGTIPPHQESISVQGTFLAPYLLQVEAYRLHPPGRRDLASYVGILAILLSWGAPLLRRDRSASTP